MTWAPPAVLMELAGASAVPQPPGVAPVATAAVWGLVAVSVALAFVRLVLGPTLPDRVVVVDLLSSLALGVIATYAIVTRQPALLDVALVIALISFLGTVAFARYIEKRVGRHQQPSAPATAEPPAEQARREGLDHA